MRGKIVKLLRRVSFAQTIGKPDSKYMDDIYVVKVRHGDKVVEEKRYTRHQMSGTTQQVRQNMKRVWQSIPHNQKPNLVLAAGMPKQRARQQAHRDRVARGL